MARQRIRSAIAEGLSGEAPGRSRKRIKRTLVLAASATDDYVTPTGVLLDLYRGASFLQLLDRLAVSLPFLLLLLLLLLLVFLHVSFLTCASYIYVHFFVHTYELLDRYYVPFFIALFV